MAGINGITSGLSSITNGYSASQAANLSNEISTFQALVDSVQQGNTAQSENVSGEGIALSSKPLPLAQEGRLNGDYATGFANTFTTDADKNALPTGAAANNPSIAHEGKTIDKTSKLYEKSLELESYFVKIMLSSMRSSLSGTSLSGEEKSYAQKMYDDMFYDELATSMTKNAGFGLADQIYLQLDA